MQFKNTVVFGWEAAFRGMRNPLESWDKSDSHYSSNQGFVIGEADMNLAKRLIKGGSEHRKFLRYIHVQVDITAPLYWWKEYDTYKIGTVANSTSTMHKLATTPITINCFETNDYISDLIIEEGLETGQTFTFFKDEPISWSVNSIIRFCERLRLKYLETKDVRYWKELIRWLPESWLQTRTIDLNYENIYSMVRQRKGHKLTEWSIDFMEWAKTLPYAEELLFGGDE